jgi:signal transduction histidine kinase
MDDLTTQPIDTVVLTNLRSGGQPLYLQVSLVPTFNEQGEVENYFGLCRDVTDIKVSEQQLEKETERAKEVEELKNSFLRNMSYEIRTPLNTVVGFAELFENEHQQEDETIFVKEIKDNAAHLLHLINDILFLSRLDAHMIEINRQPTDFAKTFESHCINGWANEQHEGVRYTISNHFEQLVVDIDDANLGLIINQITTNAAQHTTSGTVRARYDYFDGKLMIAVEDTGSGITEENMKHIFERFNTGGKGTGLGLPICLELAKQMGGHIDISSKVGYGTTVWVVIPCELIAMERKIDNFILV